MTSQSSSLNASSTSAVVYPYQSIFAALRDKILSGEWKPGQQLATEMQLVDEFGTSRSTMKKCLKMLEQEGLIHGQQGRGRFVCEREKSQHLYHPVSGRRHGQTAASKKTKLIGLFTSPSGKEGFNRVDRHYGAAMEGMQKALSESDYYLVLQPLENDVQVPDLVVQGKIDGAILWGPPEEYPLVQYICGQLPSVLVESSQTKHRADSVMADAELAMYNQLDYLWQLGHRHIAYFEQIQKATTQQARQQAFIRFLKDRNIEDSLAKLNTPRTITPDTHNQVIAQFAQELIHTIPRPTALIGTSIYVMPLMYQLQNKGIDIPGKLSIISANDDWRDGHMVYPALTAYHMPMYEVGRMAVKLLLERIEQPSLPFRNLQIGGHQIERASCAKVNGNENDADNINDFLDTLDVKVSTV